MKAHISFLILLLTLESIALTTANANTPADKKFVNWTKKIWHKAKRRKVSRKTFVEAFKNIKAPDLDVLAKAGNQAEFIQPIWEYIEHRVHDKRIEQGKELLKKHEKTLIKIEKKYGVDRHILVAVWALESNYGSHMGTKNVIQSLATLAYKGKRRRFGRSQLLAALKILQKGDIKPSNMLGSWAGAMGHTQFIPTTYNAYAVDYDGDGKRDIWTNKFDALASTANYLRVSKWSKGKTWGYEVTLPKKFNYGLAKRKRYRSIKKWKKLGVRRVNGKKFPRIKDKAVLRLPAGAKGPAFLILSNFRAILRYNASFAYALSVGHMADRLRGGKRFITPWPISEKIIILRSEREELQKRLIQKGYDIGSVDGIFGAKTESAVKDLQQKIGVVADGIPTKQLLNMLRKQ